MSVASIFASHHLALFTSETSDDSHWDFLSLQTGFNGDDDQDKFEVYHQLSTIGAYVMAVGFFMTAFYLLQSLASGKKAPTNPWGGNSLEWHTPSPPPLENFHGVPVATDPYELDHFDYDPVTGNYSSQTSKGTA